MFLILLFIFGGILLSNSFPQKTLYEGDECVIKNMPGLCKVQNACPKLKEDFENGEISNDDIPHCGFKVNEEIICCPAFNFTVPRISERASEAYCKKLEKNSSKVQSINIAGGNTTKPGEYPHMVAIGKEVKENEFIQTCGGTLITDKFVLTAAHCVTRRGLEPDIVFLGAEQLNDTEGELIKIKKTYPHDGYDARTHYNDIAIIEMDHEVQLTPFIIPTCLNTNTTFPLPDVEVTVTGWGQLGSGKPKSIDLLFVNLAVISKEKCNEEFEKINVLHKLQNGIMDTQICAHREGKDSCHGDSGGPLVYAKNRNFAQFRVVGIVSFSNGCASGAPGVYTRVSSYIDFIENIVWPFE